MRMPWGKHRGKLIKDIETSYLFWCIRNATILENDPYLKRIIQEEIKRREESNNDNDYEDDNDSPKCRDNHPGVVAWRKSWRKLALIAHPDRGGNHELFCILSNINDAMNGKKANV